MWACMLAWGTRIITECYVPRSTGWRRRDKKTTAMHCRHLTTRLPGIIYKDKAWNRHSQSQTQAVGNIAKQKDRWTEQRSDMQANSHSNSIAHVHTCTLAPTHTHAQKEMKGERWVGGKEIERDVVLPLIPLWMGEAGLLVTPKYGYFCNLLSSTFLPAPPFSYLSSRSPPILVVVFLVFWNLASLSRVFR